MTDWWLQYEERAEGLNKAGYHGAADDIRTLVDGLRQYERELETVRRERDEWQRAASVEAPLADEWLQAARRFLSRAVRPQEPR